MDRDDWMYLGCCLLVGIGFWRACGDGCGLIAGGCAVAFPFVVSMLRSRKGPDK